MNALATTLMRPVAAIGRAITTVGSGGIRFVDGSWYSSGILLGRTTINYRTEVGDPSQNSIVVAVVGWIARNFPEAPVRVLRANPDGTSAPIPPSGAGPGAMLRLLERPNPYYSGTLQWIATVTDLFVRGDAFWVKVRNEVDRVVELWWVPWFMMRPYWEPGSGRFIDSYIYTVDSVEYRIKASDVIHFRDGIDPLNPRRGLSKLASLFREIFTDDEGANFTAVLLKNFAVPGVILAPTNTGGPGVKTDPEAVKQKYIESFGGDNRGHVMALSHPTDVKVISWSPDQMNLRDLRRIPEERISAVLGVSAIVAGLGAGLERSTFTNFGEARRAAYQESIVPLQRLISGDLEMFLLTEFADIDADPLDVDFDTAKASALQDALDAVWRRSESAAKVGLITRGAFKEATGQPVTTADDVYILPQNYSIIGAGSDPSTPGPGSPRQVPTGAVEASEVRCTGCGRLLAEAATSYRITCPRCKVVNEEMAVA